MRVGVWRITQCLAFTLDVFTGIKSYLSISEGKGEVL